jgi:hypothetical protein
MNKVLLPFLVVIIIGVVIYFSYDQNQEQYQAFSSITIENSKSEVQRLMGEPGEITAGRWFFHFWGGMETKSEKKNSCDSGLWFDSRSKMFDPIYYSVCFDINNKVVSKVLVRKVDLENLGKREHGKSGS